MIHFPEMPIVSAGFKALTPWEPMIGKMIELFYPAHQEDAQKQYAGRVPHIDVGDYLHNWYTTKNLEPQLKFAFVSVISRIQGSEVWVETFALSMSEHATYIQAQVAQRELHDPKTTIQ